MIGFKVPAPGDLTPGFRLRATTDAETRPEDLRGKWAGLYCHPEDNSPGCTVEAQEFSALKVEFAAPGCEVPGMGPDSVASHQKFAAKPDLNATLVSDPEHQILERFGAWRLKKDHGKECKGVGRSTFLIDPQGVVRHAWPEVKAAGHAAEVLARPRQPTGRWRHDQ